MTELDEIEKAKQVLAENGYYTDSLWVSYDVQMNFQCTQEEALKVLDNVFKSESISELIFYGIKIEAEKMKLIPAEDE